MSNQYYTWWKNNKSMLSLVPAIIFWVSSMLFFIVGMSFENPMIVFGRDVSIAIAIALSLSNTIIQVIGNDEELDGVMKAVWLSSYALGIGTNVYGLMIILNMSNQVLEAIVSISLGVMIEVSPERLVVQFLKTWKKAKVPTYHGMPAYPNNDKYVPKHKPDHLRKPVIETGRDFFNGKR